MNKNYYQLLEIDKDASHEIIEKAYKTLVKKYHPDLQSGNLKSDYEEILKKINEAYEILSDDDKRKQYDLSIQQETISKEAYNKLNHENNVLKNELNNLKHSKQQQVHQNPAIQNNVSKHYTTSNNSVQNTKNYNKEIQKAVNKAYHDAYIQDLKRRGYKIKYKKSIKYYLTLFISIITIILVFLILWQIPIIRNYFLNIYNNNILIKNIVNIFLNIFSKK